jgi:hypothetical protein
MAQACAGAVAGIVSGLGMVAAQMNRATWASLSQQMRSSVDLADTADNQSLPPAKSDLGEDHLMRRLGRLCGRRRQ